MNLNYVCNTDEVVFQTSPLSDNAKLLSVQISCPSCQSPITLHDSTPPGYKVVRLSPEELFKASMGNGLPGEKDLTKANIQRLIIEGRVVAIKLEDPSDQRILVDSIFVEFNGDTLCLHLGASNKGAAIYKISKVK